jgi:hypothetical protein
MKEYGLLESASAKIQAFKTAPEVCFLSYPSRVSCGGELLWDSSKLV